MRAIDNLLLLLLVPRGRRSLRSCHDARPRAASDRALRAGARRAIGGAIGDPPNGRLFDLFAGYRPLFLMIAGYTALAFVAVMLVPRGAGEADTGPAEGDAALLPR